VTFVQRGTSPLPFYNVPGIYIRDVAPPSPILGAPTGYVLLTGEFEDGPFAAGGDAVEYDPIYGTGPADVTPGNQLAAFGGLGFTYGSLKHQNPCARRHLSQLWNGNGFLKAKYAQAQGFIFARVDTSVGQVTFSPLAVILGGAGPFALTVGGQVSITTETGGPASSTAITAVVATVTGSGFSTSGFVGGETMAITIDGGATINVVFSSSDSTRAQVAAAINAAVGYSCASDSGAHLVLVGQQKGTGGAITLANVTAGTLAAIGLTAATTNGTGSVANVDAVTAAEVATIINGTAGLGSINAKARVGSDGLLRVYSTVGGTGHIKVNTTAMGTTIGFSPLDTQVDAGVHAADTIPAGTRVTDGTTTWVTMQTLTIAEGTADSPNPGPHVVKVRPALDDGTAVGASSGTVTTVTDQPTNFEVEVTNANALTAALTEPQMDAAYLAALNATLSPKGKAKKANISVSARTSNTHRADVLANAITATSGGLAGRKPVVAAFLGLSQAQALTDRDQYPDPENGRGIFTYPGWQVQVPEIAETGALNGGAGFTDSGIITVPADMTMATVMACLQPETNPGQATDLLTPFFAVEDVPTDLDISSYATLEAAGIAPPVVDDTVGPQFDDGVTMNTESGLTTIARLKMLDYIADSEAVGIKPFVKKVATQQLRTDILGTLNAFLAGLLSESNPSNQRISAYSIDAKSQQTQALTDAGTFIFAQAIKTLPSARVIVLSLQVGETVVVTAS